MYDFDAELLRKGTQCVKWDEPEGSFLPMWVADMDFRAPDILLKKLHERVEHGVFGYQYYPQSLKTLVAEHYKRLCGYQVPEEWIVWIPSVMPGANIACRMVKGDIIYSIPMYSHIRKLAGEIGVTAVEVPMILDNGRYYNDWEALEKALTPQCTAYVMCNPHNPVGRVYSREEIMDAVDFCRRHGLLLVCDEIHGELALEKPHIPLFTLGEAAQENCVILSSAGKICNIPSLPFGFAIIPNPQVRERFQAQAKGLTSPANIMAMTAFACAYSGEMDDWKSELRDYLRENQKYMEQRIAEIPGLSVIHNEGTYLSWIDCSQLHLGNARQFSREKAGVYFSAGEEFGPYPEHVRINFACPRKQLAEALDLVEAAVKNQIGDK